MPEKGTFLLKVNLFWNRVFVLLTAFLFNDIIDGFGSIYLRRVGLVFFDGLRGVVTVPMFIAIMRQPNDGVDDTKTKTEEGARPKET